MVSLWFLLHWFHILVRSSQTCSGTLVGTTCQDGRVHFVSRQEMWQARGVHFECGIHSLVGSKGTFCFQTGDVAGSRGTFRIQIINPRNPNNQFTWFQEYISNLEISSTLRPPLGWGKLANLWGSLNLRPPLRLIWATLISYQPYDPL